MLQLLKLYVLLHLHYILVKCIIPSSPNLSVRKLDKKVIERKRQDTLDMCRIFTQESEKDIFKKIENQDKKVHYSKYDIMKKHIRSKRDIGKMNAVNPSLNIEDEQRVETIVDKLYDDLMEKGQNIAYRRRVLPKIEAKTYAAPQNQSGRRFDFAPALVMGPTSTRAPVNYSVELGGKRPRFKHGIVPYFIDSKTYDSHLADIIMKTFDYFEKATCIRLQRLRERPTDFMSLKNVVWLYITNPSGIRQCVHSNDRAEIKGVQMIVFGYDCMSLGDITHEIMHVLGFSHEHVRPDRDQYITILWDNIKPGYKKYFEMHNKPAIDSLPYDYASVLHYPPRAFSRNGQVTILTEPGIKIGQREGLSELDIEKIGALYSTECVKRNREYLLKTCPSVVKSDLTPKPITQQEVEDYFEDRLWPFAVVNYKLRDVMEFSTEELENIRAVISHIEKETCIEFRDLTVKPKPRASDEETSETDFGSEDTAEKYVVLGVKPNDTKAKLPDLTTTSEENQVKLNDIKTNDLDAVDEAGRNAKNGKRLRSRVIGAALPQSPSRRHANSFLVLARSPQPGCYCPKPGRPDSTYELKINSDCFNSVNDLLHVFVHVLGLDHQHNMHDRDSYLHIVWDQLTEDVRNEMQKTLPPAASVGFSYDYQSVMHYPWLQIKNGRTNIMYPIWNDGWAMGHWQGLSSTDVQKLNLLYFKQCVERKQQAEDAESAAKH